MKKINFPVKFDNHDVNEVGLLISRRAAAILATTPPEEKGASKKLKRLIRIRRNVFRELQALNKELSRHRAKDIFRL